MSIARPHIGLKTKLCSALCQLVRYDEANAEFVKIIPYLESKKLTEDEILSLFEFHHFPIPKAEGGPDVHWNLLPLPKAKHREITAKIDIPRIAKTKRINKSNLAFQSRMAAKERGDEPVPSKWPKGRKLQSRNTFARVGAR